jgi:hypothetical protein
MKNEREGKIKGREKRGKKWERWWMIKRETRQPKP